MKRIQKKLVKKLNYYDRKKKKGFVLFPLTAG